MHLPFLAGMCRAHQVAIVPDVTRDDGVIAQPLTQFPATTCGFIGISAGVPGLPSIRHSGIPSCALFRKVVAVLSLRQRKKA